MFFVLFFLLPESEGWIWNTANGNGGIYRFLLAVRLAENIRTATTEDELQARSRELPGSVTDYYAVTMKTLKDSDPFVISVLDHVIASPRPLTLPELNYLIGVAAAGGEEGLTGHPYTPSYVSMITKGLITAAEPTGICRPAHPSLLRFLETVEPSMLVQARKEVLGTYFRLFAARPAGDDEVAKGLYQYALHNWAAYLQAQDTDGDGSLQRVVMDAFQSAPGDLSEALRAAMRGSSVLPVARTGRAGILHACAYWGLTALAKRVLLTEGGVAEGGGGGVAVDGVDGYGRTPLSWAAERGSTDVLNALVDAGAAVDVAGGDYAQPPLCFAAMGGHTAVVEALLSAGAYPNDSSDNGQTAISWAAEHGHEDTVRFLMGTHRIDVNARDKAGRSALDWAVHNEHEPVVRLLVAHKDIEIDSDAVWPPQPAPTLIPPKILELLGKARSAREREVCDSATRVETVKEVEVVSGGGGGLWALPTQTQEWGFILLVWFISLVALGGAWIVKIVFRGSEH